MFVPIVISLTYRELRIQCIILIKCTPKCLLTRLIAPEKEQTVASSEKAASPVQDFMQLVTKMFSIPLRMSNGTVLKDM